VGSVQVLRTVYLVGFDGSEPSRHALDRAIADARTDSAEVVVGVVLDMPFDPTELPTAGMGPALDVADTETPKLEARIDAGDVPPALQSAVETGQHALDRSGLRGEVAWRMGPLVEELIKLAQGNGAVRIYLGPHHHQRFDALRGDLVKTLSKHTRWDVIVVE
jgi:nucleotide-binding universal stress UspA family protein